MFASFEWMMAARYLRPRKAEGFISVIAGFSFLGIALGVATLIIVMAVMNGFREELLTRILGLNGHIMVQGYGRVMTDYDDLAAKVSKLPNVQLVSPMIEGQVMVTNQGRASGAVVRGLKPEHLKQRKIIADNITMGDLSQFGGKDTIILGSRLASKLGVIPGDRVTVVSAQSRQTAFGSIPRTKSYRVVAAFEAGMYEYDSSFMYMPLEAAQLYFKKKGKVNGLEVMMGSVSQVNDVLPAMQNLAKGKATVFDWKRVNSSFFNAIEVERNVMFLILTLIILVAAFNIISSLIMLVKDKGRDIAVMRTMGATRGAIMRIFFIAGSSIGVIGTLAGVGLGVSFATNIEEIRRAIESMTGNDLFAAEIYFLSKLPAKLDSTETLLVAAMAIVISFLATIYPSWRAARLDPVEALRYE